MHKIYEYEWERYVRLEDYEKSTKLLKAEIRNLKDDLDRTYYSIMSKEEYLAYIEWEWD